MALLHALPQFGLWRLAEPLSAFGLAPSLILSLLCLSILFAGQRYFHVFYWLALAGLGWVGSEYLALRFGAVAPTALSELRTIKVLAAAILPLSLGWKPGQLTVEYALPPLFFASLFLSLNNWLLQAPALIILGIGAALGLILAGYSRALGVVIATSVSAALGLIHSAKGLSQNLNPPSLSTWWASLEQSAYYGVILSTLITSLALVGLYFQLSALNEAPESELEKLL